MSALKEPQSRFILQMPPALLEKVRDMAEAQERSMAAEIRLALRRHIKLEEAARETR